MKVIDTGQPYRLADAVEVDAVEEGAGPGVGAEVAADADAVAAAGMQLSLF